MILASILRALSKTDKYIVSENLKAKAIIKKPTLIGTQNKHHSWIAQIQQNDY